METVTAIGWGAEEGKNEGKRKDDGEEYRGSQWMGQEGEKRRNKVHREVTPFQKTHNKQFDGF